MHQIMASSSPVVARMTPSVIRAADATSAGTPDRGWFAGPWRDRRICGGYRGRSAKSDDPTFGWELHKRQCLYHGRQVQPLRYPRASRSLSQGLQTRPQSLPRRFPSGQDRIFSFLVCLCRARSWARDFLAYWPRAVVFSPWYVVVVRSSAKSSFNSPTNCWRADLPRSARFCF
jgi:hypothetical protein